MRFAWLLLLGALAAGALRGQDESPDQYAGWWVQQFGVVDPEAEPLAARAASVFTRVCAAADRKSNRLPRLVLIRGDGDPCVVALPDGSIVLTRGGLHLCYRDVTPEQGDACLAFLLGHELAHLAKDDFWHRSAFMALREAPGDAESRTRLVRLLAGAGGDSAQARDGLRVKELQADAYGMLYMAMAGYDPAAVMTPGSSFFAKWAAQVTERALFDDRTHPRPADRETFLRSQLQGVVRELDFFHFGVRLYQLGRYHDAILFLQRFLQRFPSREVYNDLGLCHYQLAVRALARQDVDLAARFRLPVRLDQATLAERLRFRAPAAPDVRDSPAVTAHLDPAIRYLEQAVQLDPWHVPARVNLCAALVLRGRAARALAAVEEAPPGLSADADLQVGKAVALYLYGRESGIDTGDNAVALLKAVAGRFPGRADVPYNLGTILAERGRAASAREAWEAFLQLEPRGHYAAVVRRRLDPEAPDAAPAARKATAPPASAAFPPGKITPAVEKALKALERTAFDLGTFSGAVYRGKGVRALELDFVLELVEGELRERMPVSRARETFGEPDAVEETPAGALWLYPAFALETRADEVFGVVRFAGTP
ncbi:MAG: hypothetical protein KA419_13685 [Acidobacteria bacterium]|nr:hypothetical protein [Acidobacteriota bacterium]